MSALDLSMKMTIAATVAITATIASAGAQENVIVRRAAACIEQKDVFEFYKLSQENPSMSQVADFLQRHPCIALKSGDRVKIEQGGNLWALLRPHSRTQSMLLGPAQRI